MWHSQVPECCLAQRSRFVLNPPRCIAQLHMKSNLKHLLVSFITAPVDSLLGRWGLLGLTALSAGLFLLMARRARTA